ncbi:MAG: sensor domain-containing diguanylate cyclase [Pseudomonadota bacterium]
MAEQQERMSRLLEAAVEQSYNAVLITDAELDAGPHIIYVNPAFCEMTGYRREELLGETPQILQGPRTDREMLSRLRRNLEQGKAFQGQTVNYRKDGKPYQVQWQITPLDADGSGQTTHYVSVQQDVTEREYNSEQMQLLSTAMEVTSDTVVVTDAAGNIVYVNRAFEAQTGYRREEVLGKSPSILKSGEHDASFYERLWDCITAGETFRATFTERARDGRRFYQEQTITPVKGEGDLITHFVATGKDISERVEVERELKRLATTDKLTGINNRLRFEQLLEKELERGERYRRRLALIMFDIDHFKQVNDNYGHDIGDKVLKKIARVVEAKLRRPDAFARWGGEEFMILAPETDLDGALELAERLREAVTEADFAPVGKVTASFGVAGCRNDDTLRALVRRADRALYRAKEQGRNRVEADSG